MAIPLTACRFNFPGESDLADPDIAAALAAYGYTAEQLRAGAALRDNVRALSRRQRGAYGGLFSAADALQAARRQAHEHYMRHVNVARVAFKADR